MINNSDRRQLSAEALRASAIVRKKFGYDLSSPINIYDLCDRAGVPVRFVEINMEGMYVQLGEGTKQTIFISAFRPLHRKIYTCAHEYGHHYFGHGMTVDEITQSNGEYSKDEFLVDAFASFLLMPPLGIKSAFVKRGVDLKTMTPLDCHLIASSFCVGYSTFVKHLLFNSYIDRAKADNLLKASPKSIKNEIVGDSISETLFVIDKFFQAKAIDVETDGVVLLPDDVKVDDEKCLRKYKDVSNGTLYQVMTPGISRVYSLLSDWSCFIRIQKHEYIGLAKYRHLAV